MKQNMLFLRKIILAAALVVLAIVYALQLLLSLKSDVKTFGCTKNFDKIEITSSQNGKIELSKTDGVWKTGSVDADESAVDELVQNVKNIRCLGLIEKSADETSLERYGLTESNKISVAVFDAEKKVFSFEIGKDAASGAQNYVRFENAGGIYLSSSGLREVFSVKNDDLIKKDESEENPGEENSSALKTVE